MFTLGRKIDLSYLSNVLIVLAALATTGMGWLLTQSFIQGVYLGGGVFLSWALTRELDPPHNISAFIAAACSLLAILVDESIQFFPLFWLLLLLRAVNGITGNALKFLDIAVLLGFSLYLSFAGQQSLYLLLFTLTMGMIRFTSGKKRMVEFAGIIGFILFIFSMFFIDIPSIEDLSLLSIFIILTALLSPLIFWFIAHEEIKDDQDNTASWKKIFASQLLYSISISLLIFFGPISLANQIIFLSVLIGVILHFVGKRLYFNSSSKNNSDS